MRKEKHLCGKGEWGMPPVSQAFHIVIWAPWDHMVVVAQQARSLKSWLKLTLKLTQSQRCQTHSETGCKKRRILLSKYVWPLTPSIQSLNPFLWMQAFFPLLFCLFFFWERDMDRGECGFWRGMNIGVGKVFTIHIWIIWQLYLLMRSRLDSSTMTGSLALLQHAWLSCPNNMARVLRHHIKADNWCNVLDTYHRKS